MPWPYQRSFWPLDNNGANAITQLTGDVTAGPGPGSVVATLADGSVRGAKIAQRTVTQLRALSAGDAQTMGIAYATDALDITGIYGTVGVWCVYQNGIWISVYGGIPIATTLYELTLGAGRYCSPNGVSQVNSNCEVLFFTPGTTGTGASAGTAVVPQVGGLNEFTNSTGTTSTGAAGTRSYNYPISTANALCRAQSMVLNHVTIDRSVVGDTFHARMCWEPNYTTLTPVTAVQADMIGFLYDESNILGFGGTVTNGNWHTLVHANSSTIAVVDTGIARNTPRWFITTAIPTGTNTIAYVMASAPDGGSPITVHASGSATLASTSISFNNLLAKATGTNAKLWTRNGNTANRGFAWRMNSLNPTPYVF